MKMRSGLILCLFSTSFMWLCNAIDCEKPWKSFHRNCILFEKGQMLNWYQAQKKCEDQGASLISVNSYIEMKKLQFGLSRKGRITSNSELYWWVGLHLNRTAARWVWTDGDYLSRAATPWKPGEPDNRSGQENCADVHFSGKLSDKDCSEVKPYICERIKITQAPTRTTIPSTKTTLMTTSTTAATRTTTIITKPPTKRPSVVSTTTSTTTPTMPTSITTSHNQTERPMHNTYTTKTFITSSSSSSSMDKMTSRNGNEGCQQMTAYGITWPYTRTATTAKQPCIGTLGYARWTCAPLSGWVEQPDMSECASPNIQRVNRMLNSIETSKENPTVEDMISIAANLTESVVSSSDMSAADISTSTSILHQVIRGNPETVWETETLIKEVVKAGTYIFRKTETSGIIKTENKERAASELLHVVEHTTQSLVDGIKTPATITTKTEKLYLSVKVFNITAFPQDLEYNTAEDGTRFIIPNSALLRHTKDGFIKAVFMTHYNLGDMLSVHEHNDDITVGSNIITASLGTDKLVSLSSPVIFTIHLSKAFGKGAEPLCSFWDFSKGEYGKWSQNGCNFMGGNSTHVTCECNHLTNFAILMDVSGVEFTNQHAQFLRYITYIGCIISITCLALSWITFQCLRTLDCERNSIHKNLVFCLFVAELIFVVGIDRTDDRVTCAAIALLLHFFFLSSFVWMFLEAVHIIILLRQVFDTAKPNMKYYYLIGYGIPITVVGITAGIDFTAYGTEEYCWLTTTGWFIWSFTGPVAVILIINTSVLMFALSMVCRHSAYIFSRDNSQEGKFRAWIQGAFAIEVLLGSTWVFGYFFVNEATVIMAYIFTVLNSLQGLFIFIFHCLLNKKIRFEYKKLAHVRHNSQSSTKSASFKKKEGSYEVYVSN